MKEAKQMSVSAIQNMHTIIIGRLAWKIMGTIIQGTYLD